MASDLSLVIADLSGNLDFVTDQFDEHIEERTLAAVQEVEAFFDSHLKQLGIERARVQLPVELPGPDTDDDAMR